MVGGCACVSTQLILGRYYRISPTQTFNGLARVLGLDNVMAIKAYKSMKQEQDWYGAEQGIELSFQWAPYPEAVESRKRRE